MEFRDMRQQVQFAFNHAQYTSNPSSPSTIARMALSDTGIKTVEAPDPAQLAYQAKRTLDTLRADLLGYERASLIAAFSRDEEERRTAVLALTPYFYIPLARLVDDKELIHTLVKRHYTAAKERGPAWELPAIAEQFHAARDRVARASQAINEAARQIEAVALNTLEAAMQGEVAHA